MARFFKEHGLGMHWSTVEHVLNTDLKKDVLDTLKASLDGQSDIREEFAPQELHPYLEPFTSYQASQLKAYYSLGMSPADVSDKLKLNLEDVQTLWKQADKIGCWSNKLYRLAKHALIGLHIMDMINYEQQNADLTVAEQGVLQEYVDHCRILSKRSLGLTSDMMDKFGAVLHSVREPKDVKHMADALKTLNDISTAPMSQAKKNDDGDKRPVVSITLNNPPQQAQEPTKVFDATSEDIKEGD